MKHQPLFSKFLRIVNYSETNEWATINWQRGIDFHGDYKSS